MTDDNIIDFAARGEKHRTRREQDAREARAEGLRHRFEAALPDKPRPVKDYFKKKKARKKR
ncbi:tRNA (uracil-5-)-methyltransferase [Marinobacterium sp. AK62]|uniref:tRNA (Uracil-5-)-methyltransferase n=1 Tax=Marinobacterium alkalitolerans TaxID=1542925 RepID=A0ABS3ZAG5_9GAMM|nr:tRNA (uracil-5-)-methyltransferase [Marinobacterium alkalitolerans]MBP0048696.1 tRNA (uracil-5-)-methyltransferase [Marinobacterium alkalitolerans]